MNWGKPKRQALRVWYLFKVEDVANPLRIIFKSKASMPTTITLD
jgi:hypothetical protein